MTTIAEVTEAVKNAINAESYSLPFSAQRGYMPQFDLKEMQDLTVTVVPGSLKESRLTRSEKEYEAMIEVGIQQKVNTDDISVIDQLVLVVEEIRDVLRMKRLPGQLNFLCIESQINPIVDDEFFTDLRQFTSVLTLIYKTRA